MSTAHPDIVMHSHLKSVNSTVSYVHVHEARDHVREPRDNAYEPRDYVDRPSAVVVDRQHVLDPRRLDLDHLTFDWHHVEVIAQITRPHGSAVHNDVIDTCKL